MEKAQQALKTCQDIQHMIDITTQHLERLRQTFNNASNDELTKQEIRTLEGKLVKLFSEQLAVKYGLGPNTADLDYFPSLSQWLQVVGVSSDTKDAITQRVRSLEDLKDKTECELKRILLTASRVPPAQRQEDLRRLCRSLQNLRKYTDVLVYGGKMYGPTGDPTKLELFWDSWDTHTPPSMSKSECSSPKHSFSMLPPRLVHISSDDLNRGSHDNSAHSRTASGGQRIPQCQMSSDRGGDSASSSLSSSSSAPPPSPGCPTTLSPPLIADNQPSRLLTTPPTTPSWILNKEKLKSGSHGVAGKSGKAYPGNRLGGGQHNINTTGSTPPTNKKLSANNIQDWTSIIKSKSHEADMMLSSGASSIAAGDNNHHHLVDVRISGEPAAGENVDSSGYSSSSSEAPNSSRRRLKSADIESVGVGNSDYTGGLSPSASPKSPAIIGSSTSTSSGSSSLQVPRSPRTPAPNLNLPCNRPMAHSINHRFTKTFKPARCDFCSELFFQGMKCKECKKRYHTHCQQHVPPSCGLPEPLLQHFMNATNLSPILSRSQPGVHRPGHHPSLIQPTPFESSSSSCNSSTPSSPQVIVTHPSHPTPPWAARPGQPHFRFPETSVITSNSGAGNTFQHPLSGSYQSNIMSMEQHSHASTSNHPHVDTVKSNDSDKTLSGSSDSIGTAYRLDSQDSTTSVEGDGASTWSSGRQMSIREWDIPFEELQISDKIGTGRFSTVHKGNWHGDVAIKFLEMENKEDESTLEAFKLDVATFRKTRHENLILFMGACMKPPRLAIVTSLCKGNTLYTHLHLRKDKIFMNKIIQIAQHITLGMGYLHHKGIVHKDLKTKNIFLENGRAIITDFGLVNVAQRLCSRHKHPSESSSHLSSQEYMSIPAGWLCYLAPELIRELRVVQQQTRGEDLPFTQASDVYAFGTVWYELLTSEWPWKHQHPETIVWQAGRGIKPSLANLQANRDVKDILVQCWRYDPDQRPDFSSLLQTLEKIPKKRLARSPSHPIHLSRSAESVF